MASADSYSKIHDVRLRVSPDLRPGVGEEGEPSRQHSGEADEPDVGAPRPASDAGRSGVNVIISA